LRSEELQVHPVIGVVCRLVEQNKEHALDGPLVFQEFSR
jgi:hypothetical protein